MPLTATSVSFIASQVKRMKPLRFPTALTPPVLRRLGLADVVILCLVAGAIATVVAFAREFEAPFLQARSEEHTSELQSRLHLVCRLLLEKKKKMIPVCVTP